MCGIVGQVGGTPDLGPALARLAHRGPDDRAVWSGGIASLGHARLSIIDLSPAGRQPMIGCDANVRIVCNGEIYNFRQLRRELEVAGHRFHSGSDSEVIAHGYEEWGDGVIQRLRGMFAVAVWDERRRRLLLFRDRVGIKPLFFAESSGVIRFASEINGVLAAGADGGGLDGAALEDYLTYLYVPAPRTFHRGIRKLPAGHLLSWEDGVSRVERYWAPPTELSQLSLEDAAHELRRVLTETVEMHLESDVPLGVFLSGGLDSSVITALMARASSRRVRSFCVTFGAGEERYDERHYARMVADRWGCDHTEINVRPDLAELLPELIEHFGEPFGNPTALLTFALCRETRRHVTVALAGDGGDETMLGYPRYQGVRLLQALERIPRPARAWIARHVAPRIPESTRGLEAPRRAREFLNASADDVEEAYLSWIRYTSGDERRALLSPATRAAAGGHEGDGFLRDLFRESRALPLPERVSYVDTVSFLGHNLLEYTDRMSMAHALEVRVPFCDHVLLELCGRLPWRLRMQRYRSKALLRRATADIVPDAVLRRKKRGFNPPMAQWLNGALAPLCDDLLSEASLRRHGLLEPAAVARMISGHRSGRRDFSHPLWAMMVLQAWAGRQPVA